MKLILRFFGLAALLTAAITTTLHAQTDVVLSLKMSTNGLTGWQMVHTVVTNMPASPQAFYRMSIVITNSSTNAMSLIPAGSFFMGNNTSVFPEGSPIERPQHEVDVSAFYMDVHEVTKALWDSVNNYNGGNGYTYSNTGLGKATNHPVHTVNWYDAVKWCNARSQRDGLTPVYYTDADFATVYKTGEIVPFANWAANGYRLPTEAEWEKAARGGAANTRFPWTDSNNISWAKANYYGQSPAFPYDLDGGTGTHHPTFAIGEAIDAYTSPVGYFAPNGYGLYDMAGNVWEWCWDWYQGNYYTSSPASDPRGPAVGTFRVIRGGSWNDGADDARVVTRNGFVPDGKNNLRGFRCARGL